MSVTISTPSQPYPIDVSLGVNGDDDTREQFAAEQGYGAMATEVKPVDNSKGAKKAEQEAANREALSIALRG